MSGDCEEDFEGALDSVGLVKNHLQTTEHKHSPADVKDDENVGSKGCGQ